jgi:Fur family peroxide stress response transcriptional regulator
MTNFKDILQSKELKATHQRLIILEELENLEHVEIDKLYEHIIIKLPTLSKATLYRNINELVSKDIISEVKISNQKNLYEITKVPHIHLVCNKCNNIIDDMIDISTLLDEITKYSHFKIESSSMIFNGICQKCLKETSKNK